MAFNERTELYRQIEVLRGKPLITYVTSTRPLASGLISSDAILELTRQIKSIPAEHQEVDMLIVSLGGDPTVSWRIISLLRERFTKIGVLLPYAAYSAATLISLGADEIVMHPFSNLGPVDPQLTYQRRLPGQTGQPDAFERVEFGAEDLKNFTQYVRNDIGITDQEQLGRAFELVCKEVGTIPIGVAKRSSQLALQMGEQLLSLHLADGNKARSIAEALNSSFYHHGYPLGRKEVEKIGLPVIRPDQQLEDLLWQVWEDLEEEMECSVPYEPLSVVLKDAASAALLGPVPMAQIPANLPPQLLMQVYQQLMQNIQVVSVNPIDYELFQAALESIRCKSQFRTKLKLAATRTPDMNILVSTVRVSQGWVFEPGQ